MNLPGYGVGATGLHPRDANQHVGGQPAANIRLLDRGTTQQPLLWRPPNGPWQRLGRVHRDKASYDRKSPQNASEPGHMRNGASIWLTRASSLASSAAGPPCSPARRHELSSDLIAALIMPLATSNPFRRSRWSCSGLGSGVFTAGALSGGA